MIAAARAVVGGFKLAGSASAGGVGAALRTKSGKIFTGICTDFDSSIGFCAEHAAVAEMLKTRETAILAIVAVTEDSILPPCGRCRELLAQLDKSNRATWVIVKEGTSVTLEQLLPYRFQ